MVNYYHILGLTENATQVDVKAAFKRLAVKYHPDKHPDRPEMEEKFKEINHAHQVLSDPYEKARYDLQLKYQQFTHSHQHQKTMYQRPSSTYRPPAPGHYHTRVDYKKNAVATAYAFGITFLIAALVMGGVWAKRSYDDVQKEKTLAQRRATFEKAKKDFDSGDFLSAYRIMAEFRYFGKEEKDIKNFKNTMVDQIIARGDESLKTGNYSSAVDLYNFVFELRPGLPFYQVKKNLVEAHRLGGEVDTAISILEDLLVSDYDVVASLVKLAEIYRDHKNDNDEAFEHFQLAHKLAVKRYKRFYGEAYPLVIKEEFLPESHYRLYAGLADVYLRMQNPDMAIKAADWNKYVWKDSADAYVTSGFAYMEKRNSVNACEEFNTALEMGWKGKSPVNCN